MSYILQLRIAVGLPLFYSVVYLLQYIFDAILLYFYCFHVVIFPSPIAYPKRRVM